MTTPIDQKFADLLLAAPTVTSLVSQRIYPGDLAIETSLPAVVCNITADQPDVYLDGTSTLTNYTIDVEVYSTTYKVMRDVCAAVKNVLHGYSDSDTPRIVYKTGVSIPFENGKQYTQTYFAVHRD